VGARALAQRPLHLPQFGGWHTWGTSSPPRRAQRCGAASLPLPIPATHTLATNLQRPRHRRRPLPRGKQTRRALPPLGQCLKVSACPHPASPTTVHAHARCIAQPDGIVTLLCEIQ
jgi:hypothetical protein